MRINFDDKLTPFFGGINFLKMKNTLGVIIDEDVLNKGLGANDIAVSAFDCHFNRYFTLQFVGNIHLKKNWSILLVLEPISNNNWLFLDRLFGLLRSGLFLWVLCSVGAFTLFIIIIVLLLVSSFVFDLHFLVLCITDSLIVIGS